MASPGYQLFHQRYLWRDVQGLQVATHYHVIANAVDGSNPGEGNVSLAERFFSPHGFDSVVGSGRSLVESLEGCSNARIVEALGGPAAWEHPFPAYPDLTGEAFPSVLDRCAAVVIGLRWHTVPVGCFERPAWVAWEVPAPSNALLASLRQVRSGDSPTLEPLQRLRQRAEGGHGVFPSDRWGRDERRVAEELSWRWRVHSLPRRVGDRLLTAGLSGPAL